MKRIFIALLILAAVCILPASAYADLRVINAASFQTNAAQISGWYWLRENGQRATWTFNVAGLAPANQNLVYFNFTPLVTNGISGGSGFECTVRFIYSSNPRGNFFLKVRNPFKPKYSGNSGGIGYQCFGTSTIPINLYRNISVLSVTIAYPFVPNYHVAVNRSSLSIAYIM